MLLTLAENGKMDLVFYSRRLRLAPFEKADIDLSVDMFTDPQVLKHAGGPMSESAIHRSLSSWEKRGGEGQIGIWTVSKRDSGEKIGSVALLPMPVDEKDTNYDLVVPGWVPDGEVEIGYYLRRSAWGFGYATEASRRLLEFVFSETSLTEVVATFAEANFASRKVLQKAGFKDCGTMRCYGGIGANFRISKEQWLCQKTG